MIEIELQIPERLNPNSLIRTVEEVCVSNGLSCTLRGTLVRYPGSIHWHFRNGRQKGTLEITWWESRHRLWFKVASGRAGAWIDERLPHLKQQIEKRLV